MYLIMCNRVLNGEQGKAWSTKKG